MLNFITNTTTPFALTADEIIYLNDIGVPAPVVTAMIQRDQAIKEYWASATPAPEPSPATGAAPSYVDAPQPTAPVEAPLTPPTNEVAVDDFYTSLSPYGTWVNIDGYGRCWQPTVAVANSGWRPYCDRGRWVYSDAGWYWLSDYSWGATTFHYGRWFTHPRWGWCWYPDTVWAPSWVTWRYGSDYCGWAPLPPAAYYRPGFGFSYYGTSVGFGFGFGCTSASFTFVSWNNFCNPRPWQHCLPRNKVHHVYNNTTIVNNYVTGNNNTVINRGISVDRVRERGHTDIRQVSIRESSSPARAGRSERLERDGKTLVVSRRDSGRSVTSTDRSIDRGGLRPSPLAPAAGGRSLPNSNARTEDRGRNTSDDTVKTPAGRTVGENQTPSGETRREVDNRGVARGREDGRIENPGRGIRREQPSAPAEATPKTQPNAPVVSAPRRTPSPEATQPRVQPRTETPSRVESPSRAETPSRIQPRNAPNNAPAETKPAERSPVIVFGRSQQQQPQQSRVESPQRNDNPARNLPDYTPRGSSPQQSRVTPQMQTPAPPSVISPRVERREADNNSRFQQSPVTPRYNQPQPARPQTAPVYSAPRQSAPVMNNPAPSVPQSRPTPSLPNYTPRGSSPSAPVYAAPAPRSQPSYSAPSQPAPRSQPSYSAPARSQGGGESRVSSNPARGNSGGNSGGGNNGNGNGRGRP